LPILLPVGLTVGLAILAPIGLTVFPAVFLTRRRVVGAPSRESDIGAHNRNGCHGDRY
jgi:hypothetical protein